jgi:hypothetical protein
MPRQVPRLTSRNGNERQYAVETHTQAMGSTRQNVDASFWLASELANAKDFPEMLEIQGRHAQRQMAAYSTQAQELGRLKAGAVKRITQSDGQRCGPSVQ